MRRIIIYIVVVIIVIFAMTSIAKRGKNTKTKTKIPMAASEVLFKEAQESKSKSPDQAVEQFEKILSDFPESTQAQLALMDIAQVFHDKDQKLQEKAALKRLVDNYPQGGLLYEAQQKLWALNIAILFSPIKTEDSFMYVVQAGDSLYKIAKEHHTTVELLMRSNNLSDSLIRPGMKLKISKAVFKIEVDKSDNLLTLRTDQEIVKIYRVATGKDNCTPVGKFKILTGHRIKDPVWYKTGAIVPPGSPDNTLGTRWLGLSEPGYGIHGTTDPESIGKQVTQGCVRMKNEQVEELFVIVPGETEVIITD
ncbi:MAG: L,D-transpeptidase family protein [Candidatus Omnitrophota bacterium]